MTYRSQNGYVAAKTSAGIPSGTRRVVIGNASFVIRRDISDAFEHLLKDFDAHVEEFDEYRAGDDWSYVFRPVRGDDASNLSNHSSASAIDFNATQHPVGARGTFSARQRDKGHAILAAWDGCFRWGEDYRNRVDGMHLEAVKSPGAIRDAFANLKEDAPQRGQIRISGKLYDDVEFVSLRKILENRDASIRGDNWLSRHVFHLQRWLWILDYYNATKDGYWGPATEYAVDRWNDSQKIDALGPIMGTLISARDAADSGYEIRKDEKE